MLLEKGVSDPLPSKKGEIYMATELRNSEMRAIYGKDGPVTFAGLDGQPRAKMVADILADQKRVDQEAERIHDRSPEAMARRKPIILELLDEIRSDFGEDHPFYLLRLRNAVKGGYISEPASFKDAAERFRTISDIRQPVAV